MELSNNWTLFFKALVVVIVLWISLEVAMTLIPRWIKGTKKKRKFLMVSAILKRTYKILAIIALIIILVSINYILHGGLLVVILVFGYPYINSYLSGLAFQLNPLIDTGSTINTGIISGEIFRLSEAEWIGKITEGTPQFGTTKNPLSRVYSKRQLQTLFQQFESLSLRKNSYNIGMIAIPKADILRSKLLKLLGYKPHEGGEIVYGRQIFVETKTEQFLGRYIGSCWNINAEK